MRWYSLSSQRFTHYGCEIFVSRPGFFPKSTPNQRRYLHGSTTFLRRVYRTLFFPHMDRRRFFAECFTSYLLPLWCPFFSRGALQVKIIFFIVQHLFSATNVSSCAFFHEHGTPFSISRRLFPSWSTTLFGRERIKSSSFPQDASFSHRSPNFSIRCYKPVALLSVILRQFKISKF